MTSLGSGISSVNSALTTRVLMNWPTVPSCEAPRRSSYHLAVASVQKSPSWCSRIFNVDQAVQGQVDDRLRPPGEAFDPVLGVPSIRFVRDLLQNGIEGGIAGFRRVQQMQRIQIRVDARLEGELREHRADDGAVQIPARDLVEIAVLLVEQHQDELFGQAQRLGRHGRVRHGLLASRSVARHGRRNVPRDSDRTRMRGKRRRNYHHAARS